MKTVKVKNLSVSHLKKVHSAKASLTGVLHEIWTSNFCMHSFYMKKFPVPNFSHSSPVLFIPVINLYFRISPRNFAKVRNGPNGVLTGPLGKLIHEKKPEAENLVPDSL
jgi:hypothetical protein